MKITPFSLFAAVLFTLLAPLSVQAQPTARLPAANELSVVVVPNPDNVLGLGRMPRPQKSNLLSLDSCFRQDGEPLPDIRIPSPGISVMSDNLAVVLSRVMAGTNIGVSLEQGLGQLKNPIVVQNLSGTLEEVLDEVAESGGFFWSYERGRVRVRPVRSCTVSLPPNAELVKQAKEALTTYGAEKVVVNDATKKAFFVASRTVARDIERVLGEIRRDAKLIVYAVSLNEVAFNDGDSFAMKWNSFMVNSSRGSQTLKNSVAEVANAITNNTILQLGRNVSLDFVTSFLQKTGSSKVVIQQVVTGISGSPLKAEDVSERKYISKVSLPTTTGSGSNAVTSAPTIEQDTIKTGTTLEMTGTAMDNGIIHISYKITDERLVREPEKTTSGETTISSPETRAKRFQAEVQVRPGETVVLSGMRVDEAFATRASLPVGNSTLGDALGVLLGGNKEKSSSSREMLLVLQVDILSLDEASGRGAL